MPRNDGPGRADPGTLAKAPEGRLDPLKLLQEAVRCDSVSSTDGVESLARMLARLLVGEGIACDLRTSRDGGTNLTAVLKGAYPGPRLVLSGHLDTVPIGEQSWLYPPFSGAIVGDRLYGRGAADMKAGLMALLLAFIDAKRSLNTMAGELVFAASYGEELGSRGAYRMLEDGQLPNFDAMIVAEPTSNRPTNTHKGVLWVEVVASGRTSHSSAPHEGLNAIDVVHRFRHALKRLELPFDHADRLSPATMAVTRINGGKGNNVIPDACSMTIDFRTLPSQDHPSLLGELRSLAVKISDEMPGSSLVVNPLLDLPGVWTDPDAPIIEAVRTALENIGRGRMALGAANYFTDASVFQAAGRDIVILGPGRAEQAHQTDEFIEIQEYYVAIGIYAATIKAFNATNENTERGMGLRQ